MISTEHVLENNNFDIKVSAWLRVCGKNEGRGSGKQMPGENGYAN